MSSNSPDSAHAAEYRPDIDGLRAVSILMVAIYHAFPRVLPSGFIGVDIFFVISGFLITGIILKSLRRGTFSYGDFYARRIRRIFPALTLVLCACMVAGYFFLLPLEWAQVGKHVGAGAFFVSNLAYMREGDYFGSGTPKPLLHLWSLGIEEQFYFVWPLLLGAIWRRGAALKGLLIGGFATSFAACLAMTALDRQTAFYFPATRFWELLCGGILAFLVARQREAAGGLPVAAAGRFQLKADPTVVSRVLSYVGVGLLVAAVLWVREERGFPGMWALLPALGAACLIGAGPRNGFSRMVLSNRAMVWIGLISYPLYLWHWPLLIFPAMIAPGAFDGWMKVLALGVATLLSWATYRWIEVPLRHNGSALVPVFLVLAVFGLGFGGVLVKVLHPPSRLAGAFSSLSFKEPGPEPEFLQTNNWKKQSGFGTNTIPGEDSSSVLFIGDSHVDHYYGRIMALRQGRGGPFRNTILASYFGCPPLPETESMDSSHACSAFLNYALKVAERPEVKTVVFSAYWENYFTHPPISPEDRDVTTAAIHLSGERMPEPIGVNSEQFQKVMERFRVMIEGLRARGRRVVVILSSPSSNRFMAENMISRVTARPAPRALSRAAFERAVGGILQPLAEAARSGGAEVVNPLDYLCRGDECQTVSAEGTPVYQDNNHLRQFWAAERATYLDAVYR